MHPFWHGRLYIFRKYIRLHRGLYPFRLLYNGYRDASCTGQKNEKYFQMLYR